MVKVIIYAQPALRRVFILLKIKLKKMVYVLSSTKTPLMPCENVVARLLLKERKAVIKSKTPFTIQLIDESTEFIQQLVHGVDTGSSIIGSAVVNQKNEVVYLSEVEIRNDISEKMKQRSKYRRNRRNRKTRYRAAQWANRGNSIKTCRFSPTMTSKINSHLKEISFVKSILPISKLILETATFDAHALKNPLVKSDNTLYQKGINYGFANTKAFVLDRDNHQCQNCKAKKVGLEVHHIIFRSNGGSDEQENLITLCKLCHDSVHSGDLFIKTNGKRKGNLKHATQMNSIRIQLLKSLPNAIETFGYITKEHRNKIGLSKEHYNDSIAIAASGNKINGNFSNLLKKKCISKKDYQKSKGVRSQQKIPTGKLFGFKKFDKVLYNKEEYFIKGRMSTGYAVLMKIDSQKVDLKPIPKFTKMKRVNARKTWIVEEKKLLTQNVAMRLTTSPVLYKRSFFAQ